MSISNQYKPKKRASILHPISHAEQQYLMYLHYCEGRLRVGVGVDWKITNFILDV